MTITFSTCFYIIKSKFDPELYINWMNNFISITNNFNLVIYTDENSSKYINTRSNHFIKVVIKPMYKFFNYKYKDYWIENHKKNLLLKNKTAWELNMLWSEKIWFVRETIHNKYFDTEFYGWCDIGYFRNRWNDMNTNTKMLSYWPNLEKIRSLNTDRIIYACVNNNNSYINSLCEQIRNKTPAGLPVVPISSNQISIAGGFFIIKPELIDWYSSTYDNKLRLYFENDYLVKDDQIIVADCVFSNPDKFRLYKENDNGYDNWFMFQRLLL